MKVKRQIIALGGGGFSMEPENPLMDAYVLEQTGKPRPRVCFVATASGDSNEYIEKFYFLYQKQNCQTTHLDLFRGTIVDIPKHLLEQDVIYVGGGNTRNMLILWKAWGVDVAIRSAYENGVVLAGVSAGAICWFDEGVTDSYPGTLSSLPCLGWLKGSACPHYDGEVQRRPSYHRLLREKRIRDGIALDDSVAAHFIDESLFQIVSSVPGKKAFQVSLTGADSTETELPVRFLG